MLRVGERVLLLALSEERDKHPLGYLSSRLLADAEGKSGITLGWTIVVHLSRTINHGSILCFRFKSAVVLAVGGALIAVHPRGVFPETPCALYRSCSSVVVYRL